MGPRVVAVHRNSSHSFSKFADDWIRLVEGRGVEGDAHSGETVQHLSRIKRDPTQPNLRQVHLIHAELFDELMASGFAVWPGDLGENITTGGVDLLGLSAGTRLQIGDAIVEVTGLRNPCVQLDRFQPGLTAALLGRDTQGQLVRKAGVMGIVVSDGEVKAGDPIRVEIPGHPHSPLVPV